MRVYLGFGLAGNVADAGDPSVFYCHVCEECGVARAVHDAAMTNEDVVVGSRSSGEKEGGQNSEMKNKALYHRGSYSFPGANWRQVCRGDECWGRFKPSGAFDSLPKKRQSSPLASSG